MQKSIYRVAIVSLSFMYLVVIAGSVVRVTGSGMGCPDWPKCFGHLIPPMTNDEVQWHANEDFFEGQMIVVDDKLWTANSDFTSGETFNVNNWTEYTRHDYATYNPVHTWIEFINRLAGVSAGVPAILLFALSTLFAIRSRRWAVFWLSGFVMLILGFEAWLGKVVVDGNLFSGHITIHMLGAMVLIALHLGIMARFKAPLTESSSKLKWIGAIVLIVGLAQILLGTQVREQVDELIKLEPNRHVWMDRLDMRFYIHRSFTIGLVLLNFYFFWLLSKAKVLAGASKLLLVTILVGTALGVVMAYANVPMWAQPSHLWMALAMCSVQAWILFRLLRKRQLPL